MRDEPGLLDATVPTLRLMGGWAGVVLAALNLGMGVDSTSYLTFHVVVLVAGLVLLGWGRLAPAGGRLAAGAGALVTVLGPVVSALPATSTVCCLREFPERHGFPFTLLARGAGGWHVSGRGAAADLVFWACAGLLVAVALGLVRRTPAAAPDARQHPTHAEHRAAGTEAAGTREAGTGAAGTEAAGTRAAGTRAAEDENVGGLP
jgi:hypothetical protein